MSERIRAVFEEEVDQEEVEVDRRILVLLGLLEPDLDLFQTYTDVYSEQVVGYYSPEDKEMVISTNTENLSPGDRVTYVHEYTHALQDQHFDLAASDKRLEEAGNDDASAAFHALVEGDATLAMSAYAYASLTEDEFDQLSSSDGENSAFDDAPEFLQAAFLFPYVEGVEFVGQIFEHGGWDAIDAAFSDPPKSTEHILHFEKYLSGEDPLEVSLNVLDGPEWDGWVEMDNDTLGEFVLSHMLKVFLSEDRAKEAAEGWGGDRYAYYEDDAGRQLLVVSTSWDTEADAMEFFDSYVAFMEAKTEEGNWGGSITMPGPWIWYSEDSAAGATREGDSVHFAIGPNLLLVQQALTSLYGNRE